MGTRNHWIFDGASHRGVVRQLDRTVVVLLHVGGVVAEVASDTLQMFGNLSQVQAIAGQALTHRHRRMTLHAKVTQLAVRFALSTPVHGEEHGILGGIRMHAATPLAIMLWMAALAGSRSQEVVATQSKPRVHTRNDG